MSKLAKVTAQNASEHRAARRPISSAPALMLQRACACGAGAGKGECEACQRREREQQMKKEEPKKQAVQRAATGRAAVPATAPPVVGSVLNSPGRPLDSATRSYMEPRFGRDFSGVRVHTGPQAAESARAVNAHAYTVGQDIVFDHGKYDPGSQGGRQLLAHELAHTVQQQGLQRSADGIALGESKEYHRLEREADSVAQAVMGDFSVPPVTSRAPHPVVSRATKSKDKDLDDDGKKPTATSTAPTKDSSRDWKPVPANSPLAKAAVKQRAYGGPGVSPDIQAFNMGSLDLPADKGDVQKVWKDVADRGALQAIIDTAGEVKAGLKQARPSPEQLRGKWLEKVKWDPADKEANWKKITTPADTFEPTRANKNPCQVDHILELQFGGGNNPENLQMLDGTENMRSGRNIFADLKDKATKIRAAVKQESGTSPDDILLYFDDVQQKGVTCGPCCQAEKKAPSVGTLGKGESVAGEKGQEYPLQAGGPPSKLFITGEYLTDKKKAVPIRESEVPENKSASTLISGFLLDQLKRGKTPGSDIIDCVFDDSPKSRIPVSLQGESKVSLHVSKDGKLSLPAGRKNLQFHYPYLSEGMFTELKLDEDGSLSGRGRITKPTVPFLPPLDVKFDKDSFALVAPLDAKKLKPPIPGAKITEGEFGLQLAPEFKPYGALAFELARGPKKFLDGRLDVTADASGLVAKGALNAYLPGVDKAEGTVIYQNHQWTGGVDIEATQLQSKLKYVKSGAAKIGLSSKGISAQGTFNLDIPHTNGVDVSLFFENNRWLFRGTGKFKPPRLEETEITIEYDGNHLYGLAKTGFKLYGFSGTIHVKYWDEKISGEGDINFQKGRAKGKLHVKMSPEHKFSGSGELTYQITENLVGTAGIEIDEKEKVHLKGVLEFTKPIHLFDAKGDSYEIFHVEVDIPIPGLSIPKVGGVNAVIKGGLYAGYQIGPGEIRNLKAKAEFDPFEDKPDLDIILTGELYIGMNAHITGTVSGGVKVSILVASVSGGLGISATAALKGEVVSKIEFHYQKSRFEVSADFKVLLDLILSLVVCAWIHAEAGFWKLKVETTKVWKLKSFRYDSGLKLGMQLKRPIRYASDEGFQFPSLSDIDWITPKVDTSDLLGRLFGQQDPSPNEDVDGAQECGR